MLSFTKFLVENALVQPSALMTQQQQKPQLNANQVQQIVSNNNDKLGLKITQESLAGAPGLHHASDTRIGEKISGNANAANYAANKATEHSMQKASTYSQLTAMHKPRAPMGKMPGNPTEFHGHI